MYVEQSLYVKQVIPIPHALQIYLVKFTFIVIEIKVLQCFMQSPIQTHACFTYQNVRVAHLDKTVLGNVIVMVKMSVTR